MKEKRPVFLNNKMEKPREELGPIRHGLQAQ
jgi:hypothetical protein